jgi:dihydrolipoamide dehydrogenase
MSNLTEVRIPDIGDVDEVIVAEILVAPGDRVVADTSLITLESDKASMEIPAPAGGTVREVRVAVGDTVAEGSVVALIESDGAVAEATDASSPAPPAVTREPAAPEPEAAARPAPPRRGATGSIDSPAVAAPDAAPRPASAVVALDDLPAADLRVDVMVLGSGPGGYTAAFRAADLGLSVALVERDATLGGVCLNVGCIPSKAMLHAAAILDEAEEFRSRGIDFGKPKIDLEALGAWKDGVVARLTKGLGQLAGKRKVTIVNGSGAFTGPNVISVKAADSEQTVAFSSAIIAVGSRPVTIPGWPEDPRIWTSNDAIRFSEVPKRLLVVGGGIIGLEMAQVYSSLGSRVTVVELLDGIMPGADRDLVRPLERRIKRRYEAIHTGVKVTGIRPLKRSLKVSFEGKGAPDESDFDAVLVSVGRAPNGGSIAADQAGVRVDERGFIAVDDQQRTNVSHIYAIGDVVGQPMLAHKATHEGKVAAEVIAGQPSRFDARVIPSVAYTDPEVAWVGVTMEEAASKGIEVETAAIPWAASGRALGMGRVDGLTRAIFDKATERLIGVGVVGPHAGDLIAEAALAIEMGATPADIGMTIHPHPTLSETLAFAAEAVEGTITDLYMPRSS